MNLHRLLHLPHLYLIFTSIIKSQKVSSCKLLIARSHFLGESRLSLVACSPFDHDLHQERDEDDEEDHDDQHDDENHKHDEDDDSVPL